MFVNCKDVGLEASAGLLIVVTPTIGGRPLIKKPVGGNMFDELEIGEIVEPDAELVCISWGNFESAPVGVEVVAASTGIVSEVQVLDG